MSITFANPSGLPHVPLYQHVSVATGSRTVHTAGQVSWDADGQVVGAGDLAAQVEQCFHNIATALAGVGASLDDVVKLTGYFVGLDERAVEAYGEGVARAVSALGVQTPQAPLTGIGVAALAGPELLVEIEAVAILD